MNKTVTAPEQGSIVPVDAGGLHALGHRPGDRPIVRIHLLGPMRATTYLGDNVLPHGKRARAVLGYLCLAAGEPVPCARLATLLWDRLDDAAAQTNLCQALRELSSAFGVFAKELIATGQDTVRVNVDACWIDALAALTLDPLTLDFPQGDLQALCGGDLLEDLDGASASFDRWLLDERTRVTEHLQSLLARELDHAGPKSSASRRLKRALADMREQAEALRDFARRRDARQKALQAEPSPQEGAPSPAEQASYSGENWGSAAADPVLLRGPRARQASASGRDRLRVGVLPFLSSGSEKEDNLAFSLSQEIAAALARFRWFDVIAPMALRFTPTMRFIDEHQLRRMDLDYVVDGTISGTGKYIQISVRLMDLAEYARPVWGECFNLARGELHRLNELVTTRIVGRIDPVILFIEGQPKRREHYGATGLLLLAIPLIFSMERRKYQQAGQLISQALEIDPDNSMAAAWAAHWHLFSIGQGWALRPEQAFATVRKYALRAIKLDPDNAEALGIYAHCCSFADKDFDTALHYFDRSLRLNPSLAFIWGLSAPTYCYVGEPETALQRLDRYRDLAPFDPYYSWFETLYTIAYTMKGDYERAVTVGRRAIRAIPDFVNGYKPLIASLGHLGRRDEAKPYIAKLLSLEPNFTVERFGQVYPLKKTSDRRRYMRGLRLAGVPER